MSLFGGSAWTWNQQRKQFYLHQFSKEQPDFDLRNPDVKQEILVSWFTYKRRGSLSDVCHCNRCDEIEFNDKSLHYYLLV